ncbi:unnamed protein product, partial [Meganyctiphanes norvegica]
TMFFLAFSFFPSESTSSSCMHSSMVGSSWSSTILCFSNLDILIFVSLFFFLSLTLLLVLDAIVLDAISKLSSPPSNIAWSDFTLPGLGVLFGLMFDETLGVLVVASF